MTRSGGPLGSGWRENAQPVQGLGHHLAGGGNAFAEAEAEEKAVVLPRGRCQHVADVRRGQFALASGCLWHGGIDQLQGIVVNDVAPDGPAAQAGIRANDVIISVNDKPAVSALETMDQVAEIRPGSEIPVVIMRDDKKITLHIAVQEYPATN